MGLGRHLNDSLYRDGYVHLPGIVPSALVNEALRAINHSLGSEGIPKDELPTLRASTFTPELVKSAAICDLYRGSPLPALVADAIGPGAIPTPTRGQIALRFPSLGPVTAAGPHIDGIAYPGNGVPPGTLDHFTALAAVFLSDAAEPDRGNFTVWPGSHKVIEGYVQKHGPASLVGGLPPLPFGPPRPLLVRAGDAVLAHYQLAHAVAANLGPHVRYAVFFRLRHVHHPTDGRTLSDLFSEWAGIEIPTGS